MTEGRTFGMAGMRAFRMTEGRAFRMTEGRAFRMTEGRAFRMTEGRAFGMAERRNGHRPFTTRLLRQVPKGPCKTNQRFDLHATASQ